MSINCWIWPHPVNDKGDDSVRELSISLRKNLCADSDAFPPLSPSPTTNQTTNRRLILDCFTHVTEVCPVALKAARLLRGSAHSRRHLILIPQGKHSESAIEDQFVSSTCSSFGVRLFNLPEALEQPVQPPNSPHRPPEPPMKQATAMQLQRMSLWE